MRIAHVNMFYLPTFGGVEKVIYELAVRQVKEGHEVHVFCCDSDKNKRLEKKEELIDGVYVHRMPYWIRLSLNTFLWPSLLWKFKGRFDIVHSHVSGHLYVLILGLLSRIKKFKHVHTTHCPWTDTAFRPRILKPFLFLNNLFLNKIAFMMIDKVIAITPWEISILKRYIKNSNKIIVIPNGTDKIFFQKVKNNKFREKYNIKEKNLVLFFGRLNPTKGPEMLAKSAINITKSREGENIFFLWVGPDEGKAEEVKDMIKNYSNMKYIGPLKDKKEIAEMYQDSDVYVLPSYREGLPLTLFEAMASGLPIIASPVNGVPYEMAENENGFFVDYGDVDNLSKKILELLNNKTLMKKISKNNKEKAKNFDWDRIYKSYMRSMNCW